MREAASWLERRAASPFFLWVHLFDPHFEYSPPPPFRSDYAHRPYDGEIAYTDQQIGSLLETLDDLGLRKNALIALLSDHGEGLGEHDESTHGVFLYESTLRVPLILSCPRFLPR